MARLTGRTAPRATKASIAGVFGRAAPTYERAGPRFFGDVAGRLVALADLPAGARVLDVATGTGAALFEAARRVGPTGTVVGLDLAEPMVAEARRRGREARVADPAVLVMDAERLGFRAGVFDAVLCASALYLLPRPEQALRGFARVLRPGGRLAVAVFGADLDERWSWRGERWRGWRRRWSRSAGGSTGPAWGGRWSRPASVRWRWRSSGWTWPMPTRPPGGRRTGRTASGRCWS
jgi:ubiquinone/menaquinone biosynthesis C-methylase UbiE